MSNPADTMFANSPNGTGNQWPFQQGPSRHHGHALVSEAPVYFLCLLCTDCLSHYHKWWMLHLENTVTLASFMSFQRYPLSLGHPHWNCYWQWPCLYSGFRYSCRPVLDLPHLYLPLQLPGEWCYWMISFWCLGGHHQKFSQWGVLLAYCRSLNFLGRVHYHALVHQFVPLFYGLWCGDTISVWPCWSDIFCSPFKYRMIISIRTDFLVSLLAPKCQEDLESTYLEAHPQGSVWVY